MQTFQEKVQQELKGLAVMKCYHHLMSHTLKKSVFASEANVTLKMYAKEKFKTHKS